MALEEQHVTQSFFPLHLSPLPVFQSPNRLPWKSGRAKLESKRKYYVPGMNFQVGSMKPQHLNTCNKTPVGTGEVIGAIHIPGSINRMSRK